MTVYKNTTYKDLYGSKLRSFFVCQLRYLLRNVLKNISTLRCALDATGSLDVSRSTDNYTWKCNTVELYSEVFP